MAFYTIGQRHGLGIAAGSPVYVIEIDPKCNKIIVGTEDELYSKELTASNIYWVSGQSPSAPLPVMVKIRYRSPEVEAVLYPQNDPVLVRFHSPQRAVTPGQAVVFYQDNELIGGGTIDK
jgi:tRNA-specific 2-thiouridylase